MKDKIFNPKQLVYYRTKANLTQNELGHISFPRIQERAISRYENGIRTPSLDTLRILAKALDIPVSKLITHESENRP